MEEEIKGDENQLKKDVEEKSKLIVDYVDTLKRLQADFENYAKRTQKEKEDYAKMAISRIMVKFVNVVDDLERAINVLEKSENGSLKEGIKMVHSQFHKILREEGIKPIDSVGKKADPYLHEILEVVPNKVSEGTIIGEIQKGYNIGDKVLRTAKVRVSNGKGDENE